MPTGVYKRTKPHGFQLKPSRFWKGKKLSKETRKKLSLSHKGPRPWRKGVALTSEHKLKLSKARTGRFVGEKHPRWIKDRSKLGKKEKKHLDVQYKYWALEVKKRDSWKCKLLSSECKGRLESHHIFNWIDYPELRYVINNGITLCQFHHPRVWSEEKRLIPTFQELVSVSKVQL